MSKKKSRRDFIVIASYSMGAVGAGAAIWPIINQMNPAADTLAMASTEVNIGALEIGQALTVKWRGKPVFIRRRTGTEIDEARKVEISKQYTIAPAYNKGAYQVIPRKEVKDIGK